MGAKYALKHHIRDEEDVRAFRKGAVLAQDPRRFAQVQGLTGQELDVLQKEFDNRWSQPKLMYIVIILCSTCAAVQGMGQLYQVTSETCLSADQSVQMKPLSTVASSSTDISSVLMAKTHDPPGSPGS